MPPFNDTWEERQRRRWIRPDAHLWIAIDPERFGPLDPETKRIVDEQSERRHGRSPAQTRAPAAEQDAHKRALIERIRIENDALREEVQAIKAALLGAKANFNPDQPRDELGRWTDAGGGHVVGQGSDEFIDDSRVISDATPDNDWKPGAQYAQARSGGTRRGGPADPIEPGQAARLAVMQGRADAAIARVRELDPNWKPQASLYETPEGQIEALRADAEQADARLAELARRGIGPGPFAVESFFARGISRSFRAEEIRRNNANGDLYGCHTCGTSNPGTVSGNWIRDHQYPSALNPLGRPQSIYPQCLTCSRVQGGWVSDLLGRR
jgi:hypothetical protein